MEKNDKIIYLSQDVSELVIVIGNDKFRINENEIKHFIDGTKLVGKDNMNKDRFYEFVNYLISISNEWNEGFFVRSISPEARWSVVIKTINNGTKRYAGIEYCPNNWQEFYNNFVAFIKNENIIQNDNDQSNNNNNLNYEQNINLEFNKNGITSKLVNEITKFVIELIEDYKQDRFWSDSARSFLGLLILSNLMNGNKININNLLIQIRDTNTIKDIILKNIDKLNNNSSLRVFTSNVDIINSDKPLKSIIQLIEEGLNKYAKSSIQRKNNIDELMKQVSIGNEKAMKELAQKYENEDEYNVEEYIHFTDFDKFDTTDDETEDFDLVCGIRIESNYAGGAVEQINLYDIGKGNIFNFNGETEIKDITKDEIVIRTENNMQLSKIQSKPTEEENKIDLILKVNEFITGWSTMIIPSIITYKMKVLYVRKKKRNKKK